MTSCNPDSAPVLEARSVSKAFSGNYALREVNLKIYPGKVNAIVGENGAGKSTLMRIVSGEYREYAGEILLGGEVVRFASPREAEERGIVIIRQELNLVPQLTVAENIFLGREPLTRAGLIDSREMNRKTAALLQRLRLEIAPSTPVYRLRVGQQQLVEIARALHLESKVLIMDEPTSAISDKETELLFTIIRELRSRGVAIVYISHKLDELFRIADRFTALRDGRNAGEEEMAAATRDGIIRMMVGREMTAGQAPESSSSGEILLKVGGLNFRNPRLKKEYLVREASFHLCRGEILGISGLMGAGRTELLEALFGLHPALVTGTLEIDGQPVRIRSVADAIRAGMALVPEDRKLQGLVLDMNVTENTTLAILKKMTRRFLLDRRKEQALTREMAGKLHTRLASADMKVKYLSGGNQQKVVLAKWLATHPRILLLDEPTRGIDVGAKAEIYALVRELAANGLGIILVSSELPEILALSDRILVIARSRITAAFSRQEATGEVIMKAAIPEN